MPGVSEWLVIALVVVLLFGAQKLPTTARSLGRSLRIFRSEMNQMKTDAAPVTDPKATTSSND